MEQPQSQARMEREQAAEEAKSAWYEAKGCMQATDRWNDSLAGIYFDDDPRLQAKRLENYESALKTLRDLIAQHAP